MRRLMQTFVKKEVLKEANAAYRLYKFDPIDSLSLNAYIYCWIALRKKTL